MLINFTPQLNDPLSIYVSDEISTLQARGPCFIRDSLPRKIIIIIMIIIIIVILIIIIGGDHLGPRGCEWGVEKTPQ